MSKRCEKCGRKLNRKTGTCPECDRKHGRPGGNVYDARNAAGDALNILKHRRRRERFSRLSGRDLGKRAVKIIAVLLVLSIVIFTGLGVLAYFDKAELNGYDKIFSKMGIERKEEKNKGEFNSTSGKFTDVVIKDDESAIKAAKDAVKMLGLKTAGDDLSIANTSTDANGIRYYRVQQNYKGIPVYGRTINIVADKDGVSKGFSSNVEDIEVKTTTADLEKIDFRTPVGEYLINTEKVIGLKDFSIETPENSDLVIYKYQDVNNVVLACMLHVTYVCDSGSGYVDLIFDLENKKVAAKDETVSAGSAVCYGPTAESGSFNGFMTDNGTYVMEDEDRSIYIYNANRDVFYDMYSGYTYPDNADIVESNDEYFGNDDDAGLYYDKAYDVLSFLGKCYDFYDTNFNNQSYGCFIVVYNDDLNLDGDNAAGGSAVPDDLGLDYTYYGGTTSSRVGFMDMGYRYSDDVASNVDVLAHEYSHVVTRSVVGWSNTQIAGAINEGYSDIFGEILQSKITGSDPDWKICSRTIYDPSENGYPENINSDANGYEDYTHGHSTCVSYCAYLMTRGVDGSYTALTLDEVADLWYSALWLVPSDSDYSAMGQALEIAADVIGLSEEKQACVAAALDTVGITDEGTDTYANDITLSVYGMNGALYNNYTVDITGEVYSGALKTGIIKTDYTDSITVTDSSEVKLSLERGDYQLTITDGSDEGLTLTKDFRVRSSSTNTEMKIETDYGSDYTINTDTLLQVYDVNKQAYNNYRVDISGTTDEGDSYTNSISVDNTDPVELGLALGSYNCQLTDLASGGKSLAFTVRVTDAGACETLKIETEFGTAQGKPPEVTPQNPESPESPESPDEPQKIPTGAGTNSGHYYYIYSASGYADMKAVSEFCTSVGGYPATITTQAENDFVKALLKDSGYSTAAIGLVNNNGWSWSDGEIYSYKNWKTDSNSGECASLSISDGRWTGSTVSECEAFICEWGEYTTSDTPIIQSPYEREPSSENDTVIILDISDGISKNDLSKLTDSVGKFSSDLIESGSSVAVVTYSGGASTVSELTKDSDQLAKLIAGIKGSTVNYDECLKKAQKLLSKSTSETKDIVLITNGPDGSGTRIKDLSKTVDALEDSGINVYTLGIFANLTDSEKVNAVSALDRISGKNRHYESQTFSDTYSYLTCISGQIGYGEYVCITVTGPADITIETDGKTLTSAKSGRNLITDSATISLVDLGSSDKNKKIVRILSSENYSVKLSGSDEGKVQYEIAFTDGHGNFNDTRDFDDISAEDGTVIETATKQKYSIILDVDYNGNGRTDVRYKALADSHATKVSFVLIYIGLALLIILVLVVVGFILFGDKIKNKKRLNDHLSGGYYGGHM